MIRINLLPADLVVSAPTKINPAIPLSAAVILPALILIPIHTSLIATRRRLQTQSASINSELEKFKPIIARVEALEGAKTQLTQRKGVIQQLENERLRYPQFFDDFLKLLPSNLWLTSLTTSSPANPTEVTVEMSVIALDNYAVADLIANLETSQIFSEVDLGPIAASQSPLGQQMSFRIITKYKKAETAADAIKKS